MINYAEQIKQWRKLKKLSQADVAKTIGITQQAYAYQESGNLSEKNAKAYFKKLMIPFVENRFKSTVDILVEKHNFHLTEATKIKQLIELYGGMV